jgi:glycosyltransferase involved in cell wall biosynthesis
MVAARIISVDIIKKYESHITWWVSEKDKGQSDAINKGLSKATGEIVTWLCSDDLLTPDSLKIVASHFSSANEKIGLIHGGAIVFDKDKTKETRFKYQVPCKEAYVSGMVFPQPAAFFRRSYLTQVGSLNETLHYGMDYDLFQRLALICGFLPIDKVLAKYRLHSESKSVTESNRFISDWKKTYINMCKNLDWSLEISYLVRTGLFNEEINYSEPYTFRPDPTIQSLSINKNHCFFILGIF